MARLDHDPEADAVYVYLREEAAFGRTERLPGEPVRTIDYDTDGRPMGVEFLCVSHGLDLEGVPEADEILGLADQHHLKILV